VFSIIKVIAVIAFIILGIIIDCGGVPVRNYINTRTDKTTTTLDKC